jgi:hypothetical protein
MIVAPSSAPGAHDRVRGAGNQPGAVASARYDVGSRLDDVERKNAALLDRAEAPIP